MYLSDPPRWVVALMAGVQFGLGMGLLAKLDGDSWFWVGFMASSGVPFGLAMAWSGSRWLRGRKAAEADLPSDKLRLARLAAYRGSVPADPEVRAGAVRIASHELAEATRNRRFMLLPSGVMLIGTVAAAATGSRWAVLYAFVAAAMLYSNWYRPRQLRRRIELLRADASAR